jgi:hypothetical protein
MARKKWFIIMITIVIFIAIITYGYLIRVNDNKIVSIFKSNYNKFCSIIDFCGVTDEWISFSSHYIKNYSGLNNDNPVIGLHNNDTGQSIFKHAKDTGIPEDFLYIINTLGFSDIYEDYYCISFYINTNYTMEGVLFIKNKDGLIQIEELKKQQGYYYSHIKGDWYYFHSANRIVKDES